MGQERFIILRDFAQMGLARDTFILFHFVEVHGSAWTFVLPPGIGP